MVFLWLTDFTSPLASEIGVVSAFRVEAGEAARLTCAPCDCDKSASLS